MSKFQLSLLSIIFFFLPLCLFSQTCQDVTVELEASVQSDPPRITLRWTPNAGALEYFVYRKLKTGTAWGAVLATLPGDVNTYTDTTVSKGISYEYRVLRSTTGFSGQGYINAGIEIPVVEDRGIAMLIVDSAVAVSLPVEIDRLVKDFEGDGYGVVIIEIVPNTPVPAVKQRILSAFQMFPGIPKTAFLLGHIPVPYSGETGPDGHPDHIGAWPADGYYADINGVWTDNVVNTTAANDPRNHNVPGDGKFDQYFLPSDADLAIGRVDLYNLPSFALSEIELLRQYLNKNHAYRHRHFQPERRLLIDDHFGFFGAEAFASNGWKITPLVGTGNVVPGEYFTDLNAQSYLWSYGCGGGWYQGASGVGSTADFANANLQSVFTLLFGSYFGDWDTPDNFLRAALAQGQTLTNAWAGRPHWAFHHMGLGESIGYSTRISQNNQGLYHFNFGARGIQMALMGDPTLRNDMVAPPSTVVATVSGDAAELTWTASADNVLGYHIYVREEGDFRFHRVNDEPVQGLTYMDTCFTTPGIRTYMVRALVLQHTPSGSYFNLSQGITDTAIQHFDYEVHADATWIGSAGTIYFENLSDFATAYHWDFGDGDTSNEENPVHTFGEGEYHVTLFASNECDIDTVQFIISISTNVFDVISSAIRIAPNPTSGHFTIENDFAAEYDVSIYDMFGRKVFGELHCTPGHEFSPILSESGVYLVEVQFQQHRVVKRLIVEK